ncbi:hypothetical protein BDN67DRAFT_1008188 [Paxillus ammoniavirescens]|nr:hypothetical protein BDN67DRAFT_1008188 [Paxillus ammoniavirescens]
MIPPTPPQGTHSRTASREEDIIWSLRTQLALQQELERTRNARACLRSWKEKAAELEEMCHHLEEEVDNSRQESMERSNMDEASGEALRQLHRQISQLEREKSDVEAKEETLRTQRSVLERSTQTLKGDIEGLGSKISTMEEAGNDSENRKSELEAEPHDALDARDAFEKGRDELEEQLHQEREHAYGLTQTMQEQEGRLSQLDVELQFMENVSRLEDKIRDRDTEIASLSGKVIEPCSGDAQKRDLGEAIILERKAREQLKITLREKAISDIALGSLKERLHSLSEEMSRLRAQVHQLQKEGADRKVTIVHLNKQGTQDKEDINELNIAPGSKQQVLKLMKRKHEVRGTSLCPTLKTPRRTIVPA